MGFSNRRPIMSLLLPIILAASIGLSNPVEEKVAPTPGAKVPEFSLKDIHRRLRSLDDFKDKKAVVVAFLDTECPLSNLYIPTLIDLHKQYADKGVQFLAVNASNQDSFIRVSAHAQEREVPFLVLKDFDQ